MKKTLVLVLVLVGLLLAACGSQAAAAAEPGADAEAAEAAAPEAVAEEEAADASAPAESVQEAKPAAESSAPGFDTGSRSDGQGAVTVDVTPANLNSPTETLDFNVALNTHSVELGMDFAELSTLTTDSGVTVGASAWSGGSGGHHVSGTLSFPAAIDGASVLDEATEITLTIRDVDAPERVFVWKLAQ